MELLLRVLVAAGTTIFVPPAVAPVEVVVAGAVHRVAVPRWLEAFDVAAAVRSLCETHALASADCATLEAEVERRRAERWAASGYGGPPSAAWVDAWKEAQRRLDRGDARNATALWSELLRGRRGAPFAEAASPSAFWAEREARATVQLGFLSRVWANGLPALTEMPGGVERHVWSLATSGSSLLTSAHKLRHDALQLEHLLEHGRLPRSERFRAALERLWATFNIASTGFGEESIHNFFVLNPPSMSAIGELHQTLYHVPLSPRLEPSALNLELDWDAIERQYLGETPHIAVIDGMLTPPALSAVRDFTLEGPLFIAFVSSFLLFAHIVLFAHTPSISLEATVFFDAKPGYLGAYMKEGFHSPLLLQIAEELKMMLPNVLGGTHLTKMWAYKYDSELESGIRIHTDPAAVNLNMWVTPDDANLDPETGGIVVWRNQPEGGNEFLNSWADADVAEVVQRLGGESANRVRVPYRQNRCVFFDSNLYHATDVFKFKPGYRNRRINLVRCVLLQRLPRAPTPLLSPSLSHSSPRYVDTRPSSSYEDETDIQ